MKLALGLIKPTSGSVSIGGFPNSKLNDKMRKDLFEIVYQEPFFSGGTIYQEITLLGDIISKEGVFSALAKAGLGYIKDIDIFLNEHEYLSGELALFNIVHVIVQNPKVIFLD